MSASIILFHVHNFDVDSEDDDLGEVEGLMDEQGKVIGAWALNDGHWRDEYFNPAFKAIGVDIRQGSTEQHQAFVRHMRTQYGLD